jgi:hypothetical protein
MSRLALPVLLVLVFTAAHASTLVGSYASNIHDPSARSPLIVQTSDAGKTWGIKAIQGLDKLTSAFLRTSTCSEGICVAAGNTVDAMGLLVQSLDSGTTWSTVDVPDLGYRPLIASSCEGDHCILIGNGDANSPVIVQTYDAGKTWFVTEQLINQDDIINVFSDVKCQQDYCIIIGEQHKKDEGSLYPMWLESFDNGRSWKKRVLKTSGTFSNVDCNDARCVVAGEEVIVMPTPMLFEISTTNSFKAKKTHFMNFYGHFTSVSCNTHACVAVGTVRSIINTQNSPVFIAESSNNSRWEYVLIDAAKNGKGSLFNVDCNDEYCITAGNIQRYDLGEETVEGFVLTNRNGFWGNEKIPAEGLNAALLHTTFCDNTLCYIAGKQDNGSALIMQSLQDGDWMVVHPDSMPLTAHYYSKLTYGEILHHVNGGIEP